jgi:hypothetical protein
MTKYFFHLRSQAGQSLDEEGAEFPDLAAAHEEALAAVSDGIRDMALLGATQDQRFAVQVCDERGPVLEVCALLQSTFLQND